jgi:hypothetical protein
VILVYHKVVISNVSRSACRFQLRAIPKQTSNTSRGARSYPWLVRIAFTDGTQYKLTGLTGYENVSETHETDTPPKTAHCITLRSSRAYTRALRCCYYYITFYYYITLLHILQPILCCILLLILVTLIVCIML